jgi:putative FmdB family regulatory protein
MPNYTYHCENCDHEFDRQQNFSDNPLKKCPTCGKHRLRRVYKPARVVFKGSGFYATDNKSSSSVRASSSNGKSEKPEKTPEASKGGESEKENKTDDTKKKAEKST